ncbi:DUF4250 domain-containing protein [Catenovulum adriaticum]|uniref:DUF4250 domain-containing protein n=1 Tax=Catenovulum adriaticum TaxID=2984846 RepID=A0ABY7AIT5_9ALTE|nr:DUF4250 domain-containing protein [Catenovulum sp. TS8]WAJ69515.1 DUF4250 domain-containing protein [Catenovulum sp. TS8]
MDLHKAVSLQPNILLGIVNDQLRHDCGDLHSLACVMEVDENTIEDKLARIGYHYESEINQFSPDL